MCTEDKPIGGYFGWELPKRQNCVLADGGVLVNSGHGALELILNSLKGISKVFLPYYTCGIVACTLRRCGVGYEFYHINKNLELAILPKLNKGEYLVYVNYFGIKDKYVESLYGIYGRNLIVDNAQALFAKPAESCHTIYSPRKFVGVADGGIAFSPELGGGVNLPKSTSYAACSHLLKRLDGCVADGYADFKANEAALGDDRCLGMSLMTERHLRSLDYEAVRSARIDNFMYLHGRLKDSNKLPLMKTVDIAGFECPMVYPYYTDNLSLRNGLIANKVFVAQYWPNVLEWCRLGDCEYDLCRCLLPLPIDQRYGRGDMESIVKLIKMITA